MGQTNQSRIEVRVPPDLKRRALEASKEIRGGLSRVVRDLLAEWLEKQQKKSPARRE